MSEAPKKAHETAYRIARRLSVEAPPGWLYMNAELALAATSQSFKVAFNYIGRSVNVQPSGAITALVREQRKLTAQMDDGPWWRMLLTMTDSGEIEVSYDYGDEPFPDDQLFPPQAYLADLNEYPRERLPIWLAAYLNHSDRQKRSPRQASEETRANRAASRWSQLTVNEFPAFPEMWARWAVMAAAFVAIGSEWGPRILPGLGWFEGSKRGGCTLYALPGDRAVLSGGVWNAPSLEAAYNDGADLPRLFEGAPEWVADPVLNPRVRTGLMSFCYWWEGGRWYRGESPPAAECATAVPGVWTTGTVTDVIGSLVKDHPTAQQQRAVEMLISAAQQGVVTRDALIHVFGDDNTRDIDSALYQFSLAGLMYTLPPQEISKDQAISRVRQYIESQGLDTTGYPLSELVAERLSTGWRVYRPAAEGGIATGRDIFYVDDDGDGMLEQSSSSTVPASFIADFERRFRKRHTPGDLTPGTWDLDPGRDGS